MFSTKLVKTFEEKAYFQTGDICDLHKSGHVYVDQEGFLIQGRIYEVPDGQIKNDFWNILVNKGDLKKISLIGCFFEDARTLIYHSFIPENVRNNVLTGMTDFLLFEGVAKTFMQYGFEYESKDQEIREQLLLQIPIQQYGFFKVNSIDAGKIICKNIMGYSEELSELAASIYLSILIFDYVCSAHRSKLTKDQLRIIYNNRCFLFDLVLVLQRDEIRKVYSLLD